MKAFVFLFITLTITVQSFAQTKDTLTNENVIQLTQMGLEPSVIIMKIKNSFTKFDVSTNSLVALTNSKVPADVIGEMIKATNSKQDVNNLVINSTDPLVMHPAGIYYFNSVKSGSPLKKIDGAPSSYQSGGGGYGGFGGGSTSAVISGEQSKFEIVDLSPVFYFYFNESIGRNSDWFASTSPNEFALVKFDVKRGKRLFKVSTNSSNGFSSSSNEGIPEKFKLPFDYVQVGEGIYKITFKKPLAEGEYCFALQTNSRKVFDFGIFK